MLFQLDAVTKTYGAVTALDNLSVTVPAGAIFHERSKRRCEIVFDAALRQATEEAARRLHDLMASGQVPPPVLHPKCKQCSLHKVCMPELLTQEARYRRAARALFVVPNSD